MLLCFHEKNGRDNNEMSSSVMEGLKVSKNGFELSCILKDVPVSFVNGLRRTLLSEIPTVVLGNIEIIENTTQMPHEMLKHRISMLPIRAKPDDVKTIKEGEISLHILANKDQVGVQTVTTKHFNSHPRPDLLMTDRDLDEPLIFIRLRPGETISLKAGLTVSSGEGISQVCTATTSWTVDDEMVKVKRKEIEDAKGDLKLFDNFMYQRCYYRDHTGRPNVFNLSVESVGVLKSIEILDYAITILKQKIESWVKFALENINRESESGVYSITSVEGGHTIGALFQEVMCYTEDIKFVSYDIPHPLKPDMVFRFLSVKSPEIVLKEASETILSYCSGVEKTLW